MSKGANTTEPPKIEFYALLQCASTWDMSSPGGTRKHDINHNETKNTLQPRTSSVPRTHEDW
jgi:hypothetical protein